MNGKERKRILLVEDDPHISEGMKLNLALQGYEVIVAGDGLTGLRMWEESRPDLIVLDIMLPHLDGLSVLRNIRLRDERIPILIVSVKGAPDDRVKGLSCGVDDYLAKPFHLDEFLLRIDRLLKKASWYGNGTGLAGEDETAPSRTFSFGENVIDFDAGTALCRTGRIVLTEQELKLLKLFVSRKGEALSRKELLEIGWGYSKDTTTRTVDNFLVRFRKYFEENPQEPVYFRSVRSVGYLFDPEGGR
ncbi:MAG TPA: response regulator transcription factor [Syntrophales bacterium]|nr:response regulator transcription factor [Syntrophales bacterium]HQB30833.1 response regulator transcription factor [Syntrophales bacterium]